jgi:ABC-type branched-subunit amino acid transport system ATPase component
MTAAKSDGALKLVEVRKSFGGNHVIRGLNLTIEAGRSVALVGANGAGKSTIFNLISGFLRVDRGTISWGGTELSKLSELDVPKHGVRRTFQEARIFKGMSVRDNIMVSLEHALFGYHAVRRTRRQAGQIAHDVGLGPVVDTLAGDLSFAEQKVLGLACAFASDPSLLLLDEPSSGLDSTAQARLAGLIQGLRGGGRTLVIVEHNLDFVRNVVDEMVFLEEGIVRTKGSVEDIMNSAELAESYLGS